MPQFVLRHGNYYAEPGTDTWMLNPSPTGHERRVPELAAIPDGEFVDELLTEFVDVLHDHENTDPTTALPWEIRLRPKVRHLPTPKEE